MLRTTKPAHSDPIRQDKREKAAYINKLPTSLRNIEPIEEILPEKTNKELDLILKTLADNLRSVVNFGTHILKWDITKKRNGRDKNIPSVFLRNSIELGDSISILIEKSSIEPAKILVRSLMESNFSLLYMIEKDEDLRSHSFLVCRLNKEIRYYKQFVEENEISKNFTSKIIKQEPNFELENHCRPEEIKRIIKAKEKLLTKKNYKKINAEYERTCTKKRNNNANWYSLYDGPDNFENLCKYLKNTILYEFQYRKYSENVHPSNIMNGFVIVEKNQADILQIRNFKDCKEVFYNGINLLIDIYREFIEKRLPEKKDEFQNWYSNYLPEFEKTDLKTQFNYKE